MRLLVVLCTLSLFIWLCWLAWPYRPQSADDFIGQKLSEYKPLSKKERQARALADIYGLTAADAVKPVNLWGKP